MPRMLKIDWQKTDVIAIINWRTSETFFSLPAHVIFVSCYIVHQGAPPLHCSSLWLVFPVSYLAGCSPYSTPLHGWSTRRGGRSTSLHCCVNCTGWRYYSGFNSDCAYSRIGVYMALLRPTCPKAYTVSPTSTHVDAYAQKTRQHCWSRRHDALPLVIERFRLLRHAPGMPFLWLFVARHSPLTIGWCPEISWWYL